MWKSLIRRCDRAKKRESEREEKLDLESAVIVFVFRDDDSRHVQILLVPIIVERDHE